MRHGSGGGDVVARNSLFGCAQKKGCKVGDCGRIAIARRHTQISDCESYLLVDETARWRRRGVPVDSKCNFVSRRSSCFEQRGGSNNSKVSNAPQNQTQTLVELNPSLRWHGLSRRLSFLRCLAILVTSSTPNQ